MMPVVPFTATQSKFAAAQARGKVPQGPPPAEPFALMAAAQMHNEGRLVKPDDKGGAYIGEQGKDDDLSYTHSVPYGRRNGDSIEQTVDPKELMKNQPADSEGYTLPNNPTLFIRKKAEEPLTS